MANTHATAVVSGVGVDGTNGNFNISVGLAAGDATYTEAGSALLQIPFSTAIDAINAKILKAAKDWAEGLHGWTCPPANVIFTPLQVGSLVLLLLA